MAITSTIELVAGGTSDEVVVEDQNGNALPAGNITWAVPSASGVTVTPDADGKGFDFLAPATAPPGSYPAPATYNGPGNPMPVTATLTINVTAAAPTVTGLEFDEVSGS